MWSAQQSRCHSPRAIVDRTPDLLAPPTAHENLLLLGDAAVPAGIDLPRARRFILQLVPRTTELTKGFFVKGLGGFFPFDFLAGRLSNLVFLRVVVLDRAKAHQRADPSPTAYGEHAQRSTESATKSTS